MDNITTSKKAAAMLREAIMGGKRPPAESSAKETPQVSSDSLSFVLHSCLYLY